MNTSNSRGSPEDGDKPETKTSEHHDSITSFFRFSRARHRSEGEPLSDADCDAIAAAALSLTKESHNTTTTNTNRSSQHHRPSDFSCWQTDAASPMTSRPHFKARASYALQRRSEGEDEDDVNSEGVVVQRRSRSSSFGSSISNKLTTSRNRSISLGTGGISVSGVRASETTCDAGEKWKDLWLPAYEDMECIALPRSEEQQRVDDFLLAAGFEAVNVGGPTASFLSKYSPKHAQQRRSSLGGQSSSGGDMIDGNDIDTSAVVCEKDDFEDGNPLWISLLYGLINATIVLPVLMSFTSIIYRDQAFAPYMPILVKLVTVSGLVHQLCFSTLSSLPFAVGQVQDAGLIFLSTMATFIVQYCADLGYDDTVMLATTTVCLSLATAVLGLGLLIIGQGGLAKLVQVLPTCVVGGYLAYIGWFCGMAGIGLMAHASSVDLPAVIESWIYILPGVLCGLGIYTMARWLRHMAVLPCCIAAMLGLFYFILWLTNTSIADVTESGWMISTDARADNDALQTPHWSETWKFLRFDKVAWSVMPRLIMTEVSMIFVVAMSSLLDVAAIELELQRPLNYNGELKMVGLSNFISGLTGGYTGSYIFSQSIFSLRAGIRSRAAGYVLAATQAVFFFVRVPVVAYVPTFFFGSLLFMICIDLLYEWLWDVRHKLMPVEYVICWATFFIIQLAGVEIGIIAGFLLHVISQKIGLRVKDPQSTDVEESEALIAATAAAAATTLEDVNHDTETSLLLPMKGEEDEVVRKNSEAGYGSVPSM